MKKKNKPTEQPKVVFTTVNTQVDEILEDLANWSRNRSSENLQLEQPKLKNDDGKSKK
jgi:hypothetical protein